MTGEPKSGMAAADEALGKAAEADARGDIRTADYWFDQAAAFEAADFDRVTW